MCHQKHCLLHFSCIRSNTSLTYIFNFIFIYMFSLNIIMTWIFSSVKKVGAVCSIDKECRENAECKMTAAGKKSCVCIASTYLENQMCLPC